MAVAWIKNLFARSETTPVDPRKGQGWYVPFAWLPADLRLSTHQCLEVSTVWACVNIVSSSIAAAPWNVFEIKDSKRTKLETDSLAYLLNVRPNPENTAQGFK